MRAMAGVARMAGMARMALMSIRRPGLATCLSFRKRQRCASDTIVLGRRDDFRSFASVGACMRSGSSKQRRNRRR